MNLIMKSELRVYEFYGEKVKQPGGHKSPKVIVHSHWNDEEKVIIYVPTLNKEGKEGEESSVVVFADDLIDAVRRCSL